MGLSHYALDNFIAQGLSSFTSCDAPDLSSAFDQLDDWVHNFILNSIFTMSVAPQWRPHLFGIVRRAHMAFVEYEAGRKSILQYLNGPKDGVSLYFRGLYHFEITIALTYQAYYFFYLMAGQSQKMYVKGEGEPLERLARIYNVSKHLEESSLTQEQLQSVWLTNKGICVSTTELTWQELSELVKFAGLLADTLSDPKKAKEQEQGWFEKNVNFKEQGGEGGLVFHD
jgi:hypothetical protein